MNPNNPLYIKGERKVVRYFLAGTVLTNNATPTPIDSATVRVLADSADVELAQLTTGDEGNFGRYNLEEGKDYVLLVEKRGFITKREPFSMAGKSIPPIFLNKVLTDTTYLRDGEARRPGTEQDLHPGKHLLRFEQVQHPSSTRRWNWTNWCKS